MLNRPEIRIERLKKAITAIAAMAVKVKLGSAYRSGWETR